MNFAYILLPIFAGLLIGASVLVLQQVNLTGYTVSTGTPPEELKVDTESETQCPASCDDKNPCTMDWCNETSGYSCSYVVINGTSEGCRGNPALCITNTCTSGKCTSIELTRCCGNGICETNETCNSCSTDCGECPAPVTQTGVQPPATGQQTSQTSPPVTNAQNQEPNGTTSNQTDTTNQTTQTSLNHIVISEIQTGPSEFVELYNPTLSDVDMTGWYFSYYPYNYDWNNPYRNKQLPDGSIIKKSGYFLIGLNGSTNFDWQPYASAQLSNTKGSVAIFPFDSKNKTTEEAKNGRVDAVGWGEVQFVYEGSSAQTPPLNQSLEKKSLTIDTDNNSEDFMINTNPSPKNSANQ